MTTAGGAIRNVAAVFKGLPAVAADCYPCSGICSRYLLRPSPFPRSASENGLHGRKLLREVTVMLWWTLRKLNSKKPAKREQAVRELGMAGAIAPIISLLRTEHDANVRIAAAGELALARQFPPVEQLLLNDRNETVRVAALRDLASAGNLKPIISLFGREQPPSVIIAAVETLLRGPGAIPPDIMIDPLLGIATNREIHKSYRESASRILLSIAKTLTKAVDPDSVSRIIPALLTLSNAFDLPEDHRKAAESWLPALGQASVEPLVSALKKKAEFSVIRALGQLKNPSAIEALTQTLMDSSYAGLQDAAAQALLQIGSNRALESLRRAVREGSERIRITAAKLLGQARDNGAAEALNEMLRADKKEVRVAAIGALSQLNNPCVRGCLVRALKEDPLEEIRSSAIDGLIAMDDAGTRNALIAALKEDKSVAVRLHVAAALLSVRVHISSTDMTNLLIEHVQRGSHVSSQVVGKLATTVGIKADLIDAAILAVRGHPVERRIEGHGTHQNYYADFLNMDSGRAAVKKLCANDHPFTSEALRLVTQRQNAVIVLTGDCSGSHDATADFSEWRQLARQELLRRGISA
jgi:HEAT repeat protein